MPEYVGAIALLTSYVFNATKVLGCFENFLKNLFIIIGKSVIT